MPSRVSVQDVRHVAALARLGLSDAQAESLTRDLNTILEHMAVLASVKTDAIAEAAGVGAAGMPLAQDPGPSAPLAEPPETFAPSMRDGLFLVPRLASHEDPEPAA
jgi:aspartyl-tRNA(Asn)/glutamyl-tRNA(Gln) amidotransferase subunit C